MAIKILSQKESVTPLIVFEKYYFFMFLVPKGQFLDHIRFTSFFFLFLIFFFFWCAFCALFDPTWAKMGSSVKNFNRVNFVHAFKSFDQYGTWYGYMLLKISTDTALGMVIFFLWHVNYYSVRSMMIFLKLELPSEDSLMSIADWLS